MSPTGGISKGLIGRVIITDINLLTVSRELLDAVFTMARSLDQGVGELNQIHRLTATKVAETFPQVSGVSKHSSPASTLRNLWESLQRWSCDSRHATQGSPCNRKNRLSVMLRPIKYVGCNRAIHSICTHGLADFPFLDLKRVYAAHKDAYESAITDRPPCVCDSSRRSASAHRGGRFDVSSRLHL